MQANAVHRPARRASLVLIAFGHLAVLMAWRPAARQAQELAGQPEGELILLKLPQALRPRPAGLSPRPPRLLPATPHAAAARARPAPPPLASQAALPDAPPAAAEAMPQSTESFAGANGVVHKRYMLRGEMVCEEVDHIGTGGHDVFRKGSKARLVKCPK